MHTIIPALSHSETDSNVAVAEFRQPRYEITDLAQALKLAVFIPGVDPSHVDITTRGPDLVIVARKNHPVRINFSALHLEAAQRDYELKLRLGLGFDFDTLRAEMRDGVLMIVVPKRNVSVTRSLARRVA
ncbi:MAG: Hsp20/alpha crystallin family protein [Candidatus Didemnitutus sp.]|nr:Hsp20/alpha crystallin family protein [Candidatus Didemnitutus sp.]